MDGVLLADYSPVQKIFEAMKSETIHGITVNDIVGGWEPLDIAQHFMGLLIAHAELRADDRILDAGCGCGRLATGLTQHIGPTGSYVGVDIVPGLIDFCRRHISQQYPNFHFLTLLQSNTSYDHCRDGITADIAEITDAAPAASTDLCIATSLFTHLDASEAAKNLAAINHFLAPNGRAFITLFLLDAATWPMIRRQPAGGMTHFRFAHRIDKRGVYVERAEEPRYAVAFEFSFLADLLAAAGLYVERVLYGAWPGRPHWVSFQDILVLRKLL